MSAVELRVSEGEWILPVAESDVNSHARMERLLPVIGGGCLALGDVATVVAAFLVAYWLRFTLPGDSSAALGFELYFEEGALVAVTTGILLLLQGLYGPGRAHGGLRHLQAIVSSVSTGLAVAMLAGFAQVGDQNFSRLWFAAGWGAAIVGLVIWRTVADRLYARISGILAPANRVLIVGANAHGRELARELAERFNVLGFVDNGSDLTDSPALPLLGPIAHIEQLVQTYAVNELIIALPNHRREQVSRIVARGFRRRVSIKFVPEMNDVLPDRFETHSIGGRRYIGFAPAARVSWLKRTLDLTLTTLGLVMLAPVLLAIAVMIKLDSPGPVFFRQVRVGRHGQRFGMLKFRSMRQNADSLVEQLRAQNEASGPLFKMRQDPRVTPVGRVLRRLSLDELPQLFNVLRGEMSLVGPRPPLPKEVDEYEEWQFGRLRAVPGLTGLWQVSGRSDVPFHDMVRLDLHYIRNWSLKLDLEILLRTIPAVLSSRGAY